MTTHLLTMDKLSQIAKSGTAENIDILMQYLNDAKGIGSYKILDYALGLVDSQEGRARIRYYLFQGSLVQRNYASLYFKRLGHIDILQEAVELGCIDAHQAFSS